MTRQRLLAIGLLTVLASQSVAAQEARLAGRLAPGPLAAAQRIIDSATAMGLPAEPLVLKTLEGASKGADSLRIVNALRTLVGHLTVARQLFGPEASEGELVAAAAALRAGAPRPSLARLTRLRPRDLTVPLSVLADLLVSGVSPEEAWNSVFVMAEDGASDAAFLALRDRLSKSRPGLPPPAERPPTAPLPGTERTP